MISRRLTLMLFAALWLPFQAMAAQTMAFCIHGHASVPAQMADAAFEIGDCPLHHAGSDHHAPKPSGERDPGCDQCGFCHLAGAAVMSGPEHVAVVLPADRGFAAAEYRAPASNVPEPPLYPPKRVA